LTPIFEIEHHAFTPEIIVILEKYFGEYADDVFAKSPILGYLNIKRRIDRLMLINGNFRVLV